MTPHGRRLAEKAREPGKAMRWLWLSLLLLFADQASKYMASTMLAYGENVPVTPFFNWVHRHNTGAAFSFLADVGGWPQPLFVGLALVISILLVYWLWRSPRVLSYRLALSAILGGALGNAADRLRLGYVEDFLDFHYAQWHWPSFNRADVWIVLGAFLFIWAEIRHQPGSQRH